VIDHRRFLTPAPTATVLPYFGGPWVETGHRRLRLRGRAAPGFWVMQVRGRDAVPIEPAEAPDLGRLPAVRGYTCGGYLITTAGRPMRLALAPTEEPLRFAPLVARRWPSSELIFDALDFESGVEDAVRSAFEARGSLRAVRGVPAPLRAAFAYAVVLRAAAETGINARPIEARSAAAEIADRGDAGARELLERLRSQRLAAQLRPEAPPAEPDLRGRAVLEGRRAEQSLAAITRALDRTGAALRHARALGEEELELRYDFMGERFVTIVDAATLQVIDAGICLAGADRRLTLESLPGVIREAIEIDDLNITAW
jgi:hypothetical protein